MLATVVLLIQCVKLPLKTTGTVVPIMPEEGLIDMVGVKGRTAKELKLTISPPVLSVTVRAPTGAVVAIVMLTTALVGLLTFT